MMRFMPWVVIAYAVIILGGGMMGFAKAHSWPSIIMGTIAAILLICAAIGMFNKSVLGYFGAMGIAFILSVFFTYRFFQSFKLMPAGLVAILSILTFIVLAAARLKP
jgi:uncharacterized membrane protein (UPF0136 family)